MKTLFCFWKGLLEKAFVNGSQLLNPLSGTFKKILLTCVILSNVFSASISQGQAIVRDKTLGASFDDFLFSTISTPDGGYLLAGHSKSNASGDKSANSRGQSDYWIVKIDAQQNKQWDKTFGGDNYDEITDVVLAPDGGYLLLGWSSSGISGDKSTSNKGSEDFWLIKIDRKGNKVWEKTFGGSGRDVPFSIISIPGGYLLAGFSDSNISGDKSQNSKGGLDYWIVKINNHGSKIWDKTIGGNLDDNLRSVTPIHDGYLLGGSSYSDISGDKSENSRGSTSDYWIVKINRQGNKVWDKTLGGSGFDVLAYTTRSPDGGYVVAGYSGSDASQDKSENSKGSLDCWVLKLDHAGNKVWDKTFGGELDDIFTSAASTPDGGYLLAASSSSNASGDKTENSKGSSDYWVIKIDNLGNKKWDKTVGGSGYDFPTSTIFSYRGIYLLAGYSNSNISGDKSENSKGTWDYWTVSLTVPDGRPKTGCHLVDVYPLPASNVLNIEYEGKTDQVHISLLDFNGKVLIQRPASGEPFEQLDVSACRKGVHYLKVVSPEGSQIIRVVIE